MFPRLSVAAAPLFRAALCSAVPTLHVRRLAPVCARKFAAEAAAAGSSTTTHSRKRSKLRLFGYLLAAGITLPAIKVYLAIRPLLGDQAPLKDVDFLSMPNSSAESSSLTWRMWLLSEASDRLIRDVYVAARIVMDYLQASRKGLTDWSEVHQTGANRLLALCRVNKGIYVKLGQHIGQLDYLLPEQYVKTLRVMCHAAPVDDWSLVKSVWKAELGTDIEAAFEHIDPTPIASASLAQVHVGTLRGSGRRVAVKIQHAGLRETSHADIATVVGLVHVIKAIFPKFDYLWLADEVQVNLPRELDFRQEAANAERTRHAFAHQPYDVAVPHIHYGLSTARVLTMSYEAGVYANNVAGIRAQGLQPVDVARLVSEVFATQIFQLGWVHCDPHAANLLVRPSAATAHSRHPKPQLVLLDHGLYRELKPELRYNYAKLWRSIVMGDEHGIAKYSGRLGAGHAYQLFSAVLTTRSWDKILAAGQTGDLDALRAPGTEQDKAETAANARAYADGITDLLRTIPRDLLLVLKTNDCLRSVDAQLGAPLNIFPIVARHCQAALNDKRAISRPGVLTKLQSAWETAHLEVRLRALGMALTVMQWLPWGPGKLAKHKAKGKAKGKAGQTHDGAVSDSVAQTAA